MEFYRPTLAEIDLNAIRHNIREIRKLVGSNTRILGVVKADAYGHGMKEVAKVLVEEGTEYLGVAFLDEAKALRESGIKNNILVLGAILPPEIEGVLKLGVIQSISDLQIAQLLSRLARKLNKTPKVHIKIDTGMGRLGFWHKDAYDFIKHIYGLRNIEIDGIFTHFPSAEDDIAFTEQQLQDFRALIRELEGEGIHIPIKHTSNSSAIVNFKKSHMNMVRPGLIIYGLHPTVDLIKKISLLPALNLKTKIVQIKDFPKGRSVSYGRTYITKRPTKIATIPIGYGDGYSRLLSNRAEVLIKGKRAPIVGTVCMDMSMVDVRHIRDAAVGDEVVLIGKQGKDEIRAEEIAGIINTIPYEVVCNIGRRVPRVYKG